jgi:hypothetical protein
MTFEDKIKAMLVEHGMWDDQAEAVVEMLKADEINKSMVHRWNDDVEGYPLSVLTILWMKAKHAAIEYIDTNCPEAFFRSMFVADSSG